MIDPVFIPSDSLTYVVAALLTLPFFTIFLFLLFRRFSRTLR